MKRTPFKADGRRAWRGSITVEMALVLPIMLLVVAGLVEFGRTFYYFNALSKATRGAARVMAGVPATDMADGVKRAAAVSLAQSVAVNIANGAGVSPAVTSSNVLITCDGGSCNAASPANVAADISGFSVNLGAWFPFVKSTGGSLGTVPLAPSTTMRYLN